MEKKNNVWDKLMSIDRRIVFLFIALSVVLPFIFPMNLPIQPTKESKAIYDFIEALPNEQAKPLLISMDYDPSTLPELDPMSYALIKHCFNRNIKVMVMTLHPAGKGIIDRIISDCAEEYNKIEGTDYVNLGFKPGYSAVMMQIGQELHSAFPSDHRGIPIGDIQMMKDIHTYNDISLVFCIAAAGFPDSWILFAVSRYNAKFSMGVTAVMATDYYPYLSTGQSIGILGGLKGAAEYETLTGKPSDGCAGMDSQSISHLVIIAFIVLGNISYFILERRNIKSFQS